MKFAFIENRYKTIFWSAVAETLKSFGNTTTWLVQNRGFAPEDGAVCVVPYPGPMDLCSVSGGMSEALGWVRTGDRFINYFSGDDRHYRYYQRAIKNWLDREKPDVVVGESTLFHELIVIHECRERGIPFFHPTMPGYPGGRFSIYAYDSKKPLGESSTVPTEAECMVVAESIRRRETIPDYMIPPSGREPERAYPLPGSFHNRLTILRAYLGGERFNTPAPWRKWLLERQTRQLLEAWKQIVSGKAIPEQIRFVLYPLQMQPEANLDVWGQEYRDQTKLIRDIADHLPEGWHLLVKANPKSKYELSKDLITLLQQHPHVSPLALSAPMAEAFERADLVITVTGTVAVESVLARKPVIQLGPGIVEDFLGCIQLSEIGGIVDVIQQIETNQFNTASDVERIRLVQQLYRTTFAGKVSDPVNLPAVMNVGNVQAVAEALLEVAEQSSFKPHR